MKLQELLTITLMLVACRELPSIWNQDPHVWAGPLALVLWGSAVWRNTSTDETRSDRWRTLAWQATALVLCVLARLLELRVLGHFSLAVWFCANTRTRFWLLISSVSWNPVLGHLVFPFSPLLCNAARLALALTTLLLTLRPGGSCHARAT
jgi:hypothetical protein